MMKIKLFKQADYKVIRMDDNVGPDSTPIFITTQAQLEQDVNKYLKGKSDTQVSITGTEGNLVVMVVLQ